jgi:hypothetical protein
MVIPPGNLNTSKFEEVPNRDSVRWSVDCSTTKDIKEDLRMLNQVGDIVECTR